VAFDDRFVEVVVLVVSRRFSTRSLLIINSTRCILHTSPSWVPSRRAARRGLNSLSARSARTLCCRRTAMRPKALARNAFSPLRRRDARQHGSHRRPQCCHRTQAQRRIPRVHARPKKRPRGLEPADRLVEYLPVARPDEHMPRAHRGVGQRPQHPASAIRGVGEHPALAEVDLHLRAGLTVGRRHGGLPATQVQFYCGVTVQRAVRHHHTPAVATAISSS